MHLGTRLIVLAILFPISSVLAQSAPPSRGGGGSGGGPIGGASHGGGGPVDPLILKPRIIDGIRDKLAASQDEWSKLEPKIEKVLDVKRNASTGAGMTMGSPVMVKGTPPKGVGDAMTFRMHGGGGTMIDTAPGRAMQEIRTALEKNASDDEIKRTIAVMRKARDEARSALEAAQKELRAACTPRQEAILITLGQLD